MTERQRPRAKARHQTPKPSVTQDTASPQAEQSEPITSMLPPAQVLSLQRTIGNAAVKRLLAHPARQTIQRQFKPATVTKNAHLRNQGQWGTFVGPRIDSGEEIVVDTAQQVTQNRRVLKNITWTKAVNVTGSAWDWAAHSGATTYIRHSRIGQPKDYPQRADRDRSKPPNRRNIDRPRLNWHHLTGEFIEIEDSVSTPDTKIALHKGAYKRIDPATGQISQLDIHEQRQIDSNVLETYLMNRLEAAVRAGLNGVAWENAFVTPENLRKIMYAKNPEGSKALRFDDFGKGLSGPAFIAYYKWVTAHDGPFQRIQDGAAYVRNALEHWRKWLNPPNGNGVTITSIDVNGSDLHEHGLGVLFVKFNKPLGGPEEYRAQGEHELVFKPEDRVLEQKLFGTQRGSLANFINNVVGLNDQDKISTYKQQVDQGFGTLCEKVVATRAKDLPQDQVRPITQALKESLVFVLITGLTDLHGENVLWRNGKPYFIDADNALKLKYMKPDEASEQSGYTAYNQNVGTTLKEVYDTSIPYETKLLEALHNPQSWAQERLLKKVKEIFAASVGRTVPIETGVWGNRLMQFIMTSDVGLPTDAPIPGQEPTTKWQWCNYWATTVPTGRGAHAPGLVGEVGMRRGTNGNFQPNIEAAQLFADFKVGQIPFYNYRYNDGYVLHNGQVIWHGQPIAERMEGLFALFPRQVQR